MNISSLCSFRVCSKFLESKTYSYKINIQRLCCISHSILMFPLCGPIYFLLIRTSCNDDKKKVTHQELHGFADLNRNNSMFLPHKLNQCILCDNFQLLASCTLFPPPLLSENVLDIVWKETFPSRDKRLEQFATLEHLKLCCVMIWRRVV